MSNSEFNIRSLRNIILKSQHLLIKSDESIEKIVSDICGLQYDPYPGIHLNQYMMLWNRKKNFSPEELDNAAYKDFRILETWAFKRNMFFVPTSEYALYKAATKNIVRWGESDEEWLIKTNTPEISEAERVLKNKLCEFDGLTANEIWDNLNLSFEWDKYRRDHDKNYNLPIFRAFYRLVRKGDLITCGRKPGTFKEPVYILKEKIGADNFLNTYKDEAEAIKEITEKLIISLGVTDPIHISHISGLKSAELLPIFAELENENKICKLPYKIVRKYYYIHSSNIPFLKEFSSEEYNEIRLISPMDTVVRDKAWLNTFFDYSFSFEYFKKKGMKWPLSILVGNRFVGYLDCKMDWKSKKFIIKEQNIFIPEFINHRGITSAIEDLAAFHKAKEIIKNA